MCVGKTDRAVFEACERDSLVKSMIIITSCFSTCGLLFAAWLTWGCVKGQAQHWCQLTCEVSSKCLPHVTEAPATQPLGVGLGLLLLATDVSFQCVSLWVLDSSQTH